MVFTFSIKKKEVALRPDGPCDISPQIDEIMRIGINAIEGRSSDKDIGRAKELADSAIRAINSMKPVDIAYSNVRFDFGEHRDLQAHGENCVNRLDGKKIDPRDLSISFSNELTVFKPDDVNWEISPHIRKGVVPYPHDVVIRAMDWLTDMSLKHSPFWVKWECRIPKAALGSLEAFNQFTANFDPSKCKTVEELKALGRK